LRETVETVAPVQELLDLEVVGGHLLDEFVVLLVVLGRHIQVDALEGSFSDQEQRIAVVEVCEHAHQVEVLDPRLDQLLLKVPHVQHAVHWLSNDKPLVHLYVLDGSFMFEHRVVLHQIVLVLVGLVLDNVELSLFGPHNDLVVADFHCWDSVRQSLRVVNLDQFWFNLHFAFAFLVAWKQLDSYDFESLVVHNLNHFVLHECVEVANDSFECVLAHFNLVWLVEIGADDAAAVITTQNLHVFLFLVQIKCVGLHEVLEVLFIV